ncbi:MAG TPA: SPOR domain-containing protein [Gallionella sp.]|nr:SPOR domain-containing protein [Gallionella sp.]
MSRNPGSKAAPRKGGSSLMTGILVGMIIGVGLAAGLAWFIMKSPSPFVAKEQAVAKAVPPVKQQAPVAAPAVASVPTPASAVASDKPRFEFYKVLTDKQDASVAPDKPKTEAKPKAAEVKPQPDGGPLLLQAGSFSNEGDAEKLKARIAFMGAEANIQTVSIPDKGVWHRVRLGPYKNADDMNRVRNMLKQNGVDATPIHAQ